MQSAVEDQLIAGQPVLQGATAPAGQTRHGAHAGQRGSGLAGTMPKRYELAVWLAAGAGLREGEALGLTVPRVEFLARRLVVVEQMQNRYCPAQDQGKHSCRARR